MKTDKQDLKECIETLNTLVEKLNQHSSVLNEIENIYQKLSVHFDYEQPVIQQEELSAPCLTRRQTRIEKKASLRMSNHFTLEALVHAKIIDQIELDMQKPVTDELAIELDSIKPISTEMNERGDCLKITGSNLHLDINPTPTTIVHENSVKSVKVTEEIVSPEAATASPEVKTVPPEVKAVPPEIKEITLEVIDTKESSNIQTEINIPTENPVKNSVPTYINLENARNSRIRKSSYSPGISSSNDYERFKLKMNPEKNAFFESNSSIKSDNKNVPACASVRLKPIEPVSSTVEIAKVPSQKNSNLSWLNMYFLSAAYSDFGSSLSKNDRDFSLNLTSEGKLGNGINRLSHFIAFWDFFLSCSLN